ncbi:hypothetical protein BZL39_D00220 [Zygosaccharomyces parabailii]|nr:hypothetical protein BZL39_D00220 [Zygosaccharomyces parabailii]
MTSSGSAVADAQPSDSAVAGAQQTRGNIGEVLAKLKFDWKTCAKISGILIILIHLILLAAYGILGLSSRDEDNYSSIFVYGGSLITFFSYVVLYCANANKLTSSIFQQGEGESRGTHYAKVGVMGIVLPVFNFIGLIFLFIKVEQNRKTFTLGINASISYFLGNTLLFMSKRKRTESEEHELRENHLPADDAPVSNSPVSNSPVDTSPVDTSPVDTSPVDTSPVDTSPVDTSPVDTSPADNSPSIHNFP